MATIEDLRVTVALNNPTMTSDEVRREADRVASVLGAIEAEDNLRASYAAHQAEEALQRAAEAEQRATALVDATRKVRDEHPGWDTFSVEMEAARVVAAQDAAAAVADLRDAGNPFGAYALPGKDA